MAFTVTGLTGNVKRGSIDIRQEVQSRRAANITITSQLTPSLGDAVTISDNGTLFDGYVWSYEQKHISGNVWFTDVHCVDKRWLVDRRVVTLEYDAPEGEFDPSTIKAGDIVKDIATQTGVSQGTIADGAELDRPVFYRVRYAKDVLNELASASGLFWYVSDDGNLNFHAKNAVAGSSVAASAILAEGFHLGADLSAYFNKVYMVNAVETNLVTEYRVGEYADGERTVFPLKHAVQKRPVGSIESFTVQVTVNGSPQTVGEAGVATDVQWYYMFGESTIEQDEGEVPLAEGDDLYVDYFSSKRVTVDADVTPAAGTGVIERVFDADGLQADAAQEIAQGLVDTYGVVLETIQFASYTAILTPGEWCSIGSHGNFLITRVSIDDPGRADQALRRTYYGVSEEPLNNSVQFFERWQQKNRTVRYGDGWVIVG